jgi:hypothetical protein
VEIRWNRVFLQSFTDVNVTSKSLGTVISKETLKKNNVADPDPHPDPHPRVFGPLGSGSGSFYHHAKIVRKTLIPTIL